ncbi:MAG: Heme/hemopexin-binding protein precursor [Lentisphaerae bacterium ADurb.BinA184]|nr:MAG: Heme/hemopexin-binding protein precursor [Lentisphaerae bacterium ADurb.BinA184]
MKATTNHIRQALAVNPTPPQSSRGAAPALLALCLCAALPAAANPEGAQVVEGAAVIQATSAARLDVLQQSERAVIAWRQFSIGAGEHTHFQQPSAEAVALNRVVGRDPSAILGQLTANGRVFLVNPAGILFGSGSRVDVAGLVATAADIPNEDFMAGRYDFSRAAPPGAAVVNQGAITVGEGGAAALVAPWVRNDGAIVATLGRVALASGDTFTLDLHGDGLVQLALGPEAAARLRDTPQGVANEGRISAPGGTVVLSAAGAGAALDAVVSVNGVVEARNASVDRAGRIILSAAAGTVEVGGRLDAGGATGGEIRVEGAGVRVGESAVLAADAAGSGDGGRIETLAAGDADVAGTLSARGGAAGGDGGDIEVCGGGTLRFTGFADTAAPSGRIGRLRLDPDQYVIDATTVGAINGAVADTTVQADQRIAVQADIQMLTAGVGLTLQAPLIEFHDERVVRTNGGRLQLQGDASFLGDVSLNTGGGALVANGDWEFHNTRLSIDTGGYPAPRGDLTLIGDLTGCTQLWANAGDVSREGDTAVSDYMQFNCESFHNTGHLGTPRALDIRSNVGTVDVGFASAETRGDGTSTGFGSMTVKAGQIIGAYFSGHLGFGAVTGTPLELNAYVQTDQLMISGSQVSGTITGTVNDPAFQPPPGVTYVPSGSPPDGGDTPPDGGDTPSYCPSSGGSGMDNLIQNASGGNLDSQMPQGPLSFIGGDPLADMDTGGGGGFWTGYAGPGVGVFGGFFDQWPFNWPGLGGSPFAFGGGSDLPPAGEETAAPSEATATLTYMTDGAPPAEPPPAEPPPPEPPPGLPEIDWDDDHLSGMSKAASYWEHVGHVVNTLKDAAQEKVDAVKDQNKQEEAAQKAKIQAEQDKLPAAQAKVAQAQDGVNQAQAEADRIKARRDELGDRLSGLLFSSDKFDDKSEWVSAVNSMNAAYKDACNEYDSAKHGVAAQQGQLDQANAGLAQQQAAVAAQQQQLAQLQQANQAELGGALGELEQAKADYHKAVAQYNAAPGGGGYTPSLKTTGGGTTYTSSSPSSPAGTPVPGGTTTTTPAPGSWASMTTQTAPGQYNLQTTGISTSILAYGWQIDGSDVCEFTAERFGDDGDHAATGLAKDPAVKAFADAVNGESGWKKEGKAAEGGSYASGTTVLYHKVTYANEDTGMKVTISTETTSDTNYGVTITYSPIDTAAETTYAKEFPGQPNPYETKTVKLQGHLEKK